MLTEAASAGFELELRRLRSKAAALHAESSSAPLAQKRGTSLLIAKRMWSRPVSRHCGATRDA